MYYAGMNVLQKVKLTIVEEQTDIQVFIQIVDSYGKMDAIYTIQTILKQLDNLEYEAFYIQ